MKGILWDGAALEVIDDLELRPIRANEVKVEVMASGVCHSDLSVTTGVIPFETPCVLGHEGAGIVTEVGTAVTKLNVGDHVVLSTLGNCGMCGPCDTGRPSMCKDTFGHRPMPFRREGLPVYHFANVSSFSEHTIVKANQAVRIPKEMPFASASLIGCGVITGFGAAVNRAKVSHGDSVVVFGAGGVGLNAIQGARLSNAYPIIAVDTNPLKGALAIEFGATHFVNAAEEDTEGAVRRICPSGVRYALECVGSRDLIHLGLDLLDWDGTLVVVGVPPFGTSCEFMPERMNLDKTIMGCRAGSLRPQHDFRMIVDLYLAGRFKLDELVSRTYAMDDIHQVFHDMHAGEIARGVLVAE